MKLLFLSSVYLIISSVFSAYLIIFIIGTYWFNIDSFIKSLMILINGER